MASSQSAKNFPTESAENRTVGGGHIKDVFSDWRLTELRKRNALMDVTLVAGPLNKRVSIRANRTVLSLASQYFWEMCVDEHEKNCEHKLTKENVENMYQAANQLRIGSCLEKIQDYLTLEINDSNWDRRLKFARIQRMDDLTDVAISYISSDYVGYLETPQFLELPAEEVFTVLSAPVRMQIPEEAIFSAILKWLKYKQNERVTIAAALLAEMDLSSIPDDFLQFHLDEEEVLQTIECLEIVRKICKKPFQLASQVDVDIIIFPEPATNGFHQNSKQLKTEVIDSPPKLPTPHEASLSGRGKLRRRKSKNVPNDTVEQEDAPPEKKNTQNQNLSDCNNSMESSTEMLAYNTVFKVVYLRECEKGGARVMMTDLYEKYQQLRPFLNWNKSTSLLWVNHIRRMYVLGGVTTVFKEKGSTNVVKYSSEAVLLKNSDKEKHWLKGPDMIQERTNFTPVIIGDYIYAFGGAEGAWGNEAVNCSEWLNIKSKKPRWEAIDYLNRARHSFGAGVLDGKIYAE
ncbi:unnamed protein product [Allacma fusca]|uniref:BTB domain-containing protein n=1 Tax=Allacma fusca TaxID=39272 RepID=A0A8J2NTS3_9HEXA|nr:unnamed protein product [Allacma fusca]